MLLKVVELTMLKEISIQQPHNFKKGGSSPLHGSGKDDNYLETQTPQSDQESYQ